MTRYFHVTFDIVQEFDEQDLPSDFIARGWKGDKLKSILCRFGKGRTFEPSSNLPKHLKYALDKYLKLKPNPEINFEFDFTKNQGKPINRFSKELHMELLNYCYPENQFII